MQENLPAITPQFIVSAGALSSSDWKLSRKSFLLI